jgi:Ran GTPase-activating protein (RanGAP) involved in mRNA processing and transport
VFRKAYIFPSANCYGEVTVELIKDLLTRKLKIKDLLLSTTGTAVYPSVFPLSLTILQTLLHFQYSSSEELIIQVIVKSHLQQLNNNILTQLRHKF